MSTTKQQQQTFSKGDKVITSSEIGNLLANRKGKIIRIQNNGRSVVVKLDNDVDSNRSFVFALSELELMK